MIIIDYLQLMTGNQSKGGNREQEIAGISRSLKIIAKELDVCVIALSQLSRAVESRGGNKRPVLSDLRESGSIEQDADMVAFLYRPEYYGFETDDEGNSTQGLAELIIAKQRNGPTGTVKLQFIGKYGKFTDWGYQAGGNMMGGASGPGTITLPSRMNQPPPGGDTPPPPPTTGDDEVPF
jgi:replicative DNA helicase